MAVQETQRERQQRLAREQAAKIKESLWEQLLQRFTHLTDKFSTDMNPTPSPMTGVDYQVYPEPTSTQELGQRVAQHLNEHIDSVGIQSAGLSALEFVERAWLEGALYDLPAGETARSISRFLDACDSRIQSYCEEEPDGGSATRLQLVRNGLRIPSK